MKTEKSRRIRSLRRRSAKYGVIVLALSLGACSRALVGVPQKKDAGAQGSGQSNVAASDLAPRLPYKAQEAARPRPPDSSASSVPASDLAPRLPYTAKEAERPVTFPPFVPPPGAGDEDVADNPGVEEIADDEEVTPDMMLSEADRTLLADEIAPAADAAAPTDDDQDDVAEEVREGDVDEEATTPDMMLSEADRTLPEDVAIAPLAATAAEEAEDDVESEATAADDGVDEDTTPEMMLSEADRTLAEDDAIAPLVAAPAEAEDDLESDAPAAEDGVDEDTTPEMMLSEADRTLAEDDTPVAAPAEAEAEDDVALEEPPVEDFADDETTPEMMLSEADRTLAEDDTPAAVPTEAEAEDDAAVEEPPVEDLADDETTPEMMMSEADRLLEDEEKSPGMATLTDTSPGEVPPPEKIVEHKPVIDNNLPEFPVTRYELPAQAVADRPKPAPKPASLPVTVNVQEDGLFDFDRAELKSDVIAKLDGVAGLLRDAKVESIFIVGHADPIGSAKYNQGLSERRADAVKRYLVGKGIDAGRISTSGAGENELVVTREACAGKRRQALIECLQPNRRVVVEAAGTRTAK